jgi:hypothetical protein
MQWPLAFPEISKSLFVFLATRTAAIKSNRKEGGRIKQSPSTLDGADFYI